jgi:rhamnosyltransferase
MGSGCTLRTTVNTSVIIPTLNASRYLPKLLEALKTQSDPPLEIIVIDSSSTDDTVSIAREAGCVVEVIPRADFDHGGTRNRAATIAQGELLAFMTQDALPSNSDFLTELARPIREGMAVAAYARQIPYPEAFPPEAFARAFNYPPISRLRSQADISSLGLRAFFFSNVASMVSRDAFEAVGRFPERTVMNEDMLLCAKILRAGYKVAYRAEATVFHSHNYRLGQQFRRNFDIGAFVAQSGAALGETRTGEAGVKFAFGQIKHLVSCGAWVWVPRTTLELGLKFVAYQLGRRERLIPTTWKRRLSMHPHYWSDK